MKYDLIDLPGESEDRPDCSNCLDEGFLNDDIDDCCDCRAGEIWAEVANECAEEERAERAATDLSYWD